MKLYPHKKSNFDTVFKIGLIRIIELRIGNELKNLVKEQDNYELSTYHDIIEENWQYVDDRNEEKGQ
jgi:hypothetical protein